MRLVLQNNRGLFRTGAAGKNSNLVASPYFVHPVRTSLTSREKPCIQGFTLIEITIVIMIIGLLIGGILVGKTMIAQQQIRSIMSDVLQLKAATNQFREKYQAWPGDFADGTRYWGGGTGNGNGDGKIDNEGVSSPVGSLLAPHHLQLAGMLSGFEFSKPLDQSLTVGSIPVGVPGLNTPARSKQGYWFWYIESSSPPYYVYALQNGILVCGGTINYLRHCFGATLKLRHLLEFEEKYDDGYPIAGNIIVSYADPVNPNHNGGYGSKAETYYTTAPYLNRNYSFVYLLGQ